MSRNFELLAQIEYEAQRPDTRVQFASDPTILSGSPSYGGNDRGGDEVLRLVHRVFFGTAGLAPCQVVFCGVDRENGSSSICASVARTLAANCNHAVCIVDANVRSPRLSDLFRVNTTTPFSATSDSIRAQCVQVDENLWLAGTDLLSDENGSLMPAGELKRRLTQLRGAFEYVLIDAPGTSACGDAVLLGQLVDVAVLVVEAHTTRRVTARKAKDALEMAGVRLLGTVLHNRSFPIPEALYKRL